MTKDPAAAVEVTRLRDCIDDLVNIMALPARWTVAEPAQILSTFVDALLRMLRLGFVLCDYTIQRPDIRSRQCESLSRCKVERSAAEINVDLSVACCASGASR